MYSADGRSGIKLSGAGDLQAAFICDALATTIPTAAPSALADIRPITSRKSPALLFLYGRYLPASYDQATPASRVTN